MGGVCSLHHVLDMHISPRVRYLNSSVMNCMSMLCDQNCCQKWHYGVCKTWVRSFDFIDSATVFEKRSCWILSVYGCVLTDLPWGGGPLIFDTEYTLVPYSLHRCCVQLVKVGRCKIIFTALPKCQMCSITMHASQTRHCTTGHGWL